MFSGFVGDFDAFFHGFSGRSGWLVDSKRPVLGLGTCFQLPADDLEHLLAARSLLNGRKVRHVMIC